MKKNPPLGKAYLLAKQIEGFEVLKKSPEPRMPFRLKNAIDRVRWHICGLFGVKASEVTDAHVAQFALKILRDFSYMYRNFHGIGGETTRDLETWARSK